MNETLKTNKEESDEPTVKIKGKNYKISKIKIEKIEVDDSIHPRKQINQNTVDSYVGALTSGGKFPPVEVQNVKYRSDAGKDVVKTIPIDGFHRLKAYEQYNNVIREEQKEKKNQEGANSGLIEEVEITFWKDKILSYDENKTLLKMRAAILNIKHGDRLTQGEKEDIAKDVTDVYLTNFEKFANGIKGDESDD